jgi:hypothetical protein
MKLEKFDLEKVIHGARVITRDGREVSQLTKFETYDKFCLYGLVDEQVYCWSIKGEYSDNSSCSMDLYIVGKVRRVWANVMKYANGDLFVGSECFPTLEAALNFARNSKGFKRNYVKTIQITDEV